MADWASNLSGPQRDAAAALTNLFESYGLGTLAPKIVQMIQDGIGGDAITLRLQDTSEYKQRFSANIARQKAGLPVLSPAEYISTERAYRQVMSSAGLPVGFYDRPEDFQKFLEQDIAPTEVQQRVNAAAEAINSAPTGTLDVFKKYYGAGDMIAYALDPAVAGPLIEQRIKAAEAAAAARAQGFGISQQTAEGLGRQGFTLNQIQQGMTQAGEDAGALTKLAGIYGSDVTSDDLVKSTFGTSAEAATKVKKLASQERATFGGSSAATGAGLSKNSGGQI